jgi:hypothetical protein
MGYDVKEMIFLAPLYTPPPLRNRPLSPCFPTCVSFTIIPLQHLKLNSLKKLNSARFSNLPLYSVICISLFHHLTCTLSYYSLHAASQCPADFNAVSLLSQTLCFPIICLSPFMGHQYLKMNFCVEGRCVRHAC